ncbi:hypothetical protein KTQ89_06605 [Holdemanella porci]|uniref:hypothetical protein n=1 Tax=Holdemanella porci TaxID=2652276 RepID=UPI001C2BF519|nr:hypothetical protein [Holdemanella porci]MBU9872031.1 hypothetical protein [Holdemanella porci]
MNNFTVKYFEAKKGYSATKEYEHYNCECAQSVTEDDLAQVIFMTVRTAEGMDLDTQKILNGACALMHQSKGRLDSTYFFNC